MKKKILLIFILIFFILSIKTVYADSRVSVDVNNVYKITGETVNGIPRYVLDLEKTNNAEYNMTIFNHNINPETRDRKIFIFNSTECSACGDYISLTRANPTIIEDGPDRVYIRYENTSSSYSSSANCINTTPTSEVMCYNFTVDFYLYPKYYLIKYYVWGNYTLSQMSISSGDFNIPYALTTDFGITASYFSNGTYYNASSGTKEYTDINTSVAFIYNETGHNKTYMLFSLGRHNFTDSPHWECKFYDSSKNFYVGKGPQSKLPVNPTWWTYGVMFADSGQRSLEENETVWNEGFKNQWNDIYYPASISVINGTYQQRDNITGTYNFTVDSSGLLRFNFSTGNYDRTYPVFHIKDAFNASKYKDHIWYRDVTYKNSDWIKLNNYTDFVIQDGNSTYFGYNYTLLLINKTLGSDYEFWIDDDSNPPLIPPKYSLNSTNNTLAGQPTEFSLKWTDNAGLSGYIFSTNNTGSWNNDSFVDSENQTGDVFFFDGFESGDFSAWDLIFVSENETTGIEDTAEVITTDPYHGNYHAKFTDDGSDWAEQAVVQYDSFTAQSEVYKRSYIKFKSGLPQYDDRRIAFMVLYAGGANTVLEARVSKSTDIWQLYYFKDGSYVTLDYTSGPSLDTWYNVEIYIKIHDTQGEVRMYVNGTEILSDSGFDNDDYGNVVAARVGLISYCYIDTVQSVYVDSVVLSNSYIGSIKTWSNVTKTLNDTVGALIQWKFYANDTSNNWNTSQTYSLTTTSDIIITIESSKMSSNRQIISRPNSNILVYGKAFYTSGAVYANQQLTFIYDTRSLGTNDTDSSGNYWFTFSIPYEGSYNLTVTAVDISGNTGENSSSLFISTHPLNVKFNFAFHLGTSKAYNNFTIYKNSVVDSWENVTNTTKRYLCSHDGNNLLSLIHSGKDSYFYSSTLNQSYSSTDYLFALTNDVENSQLLLAYTKGTCSVVEDKMYLVESYSIPTNAFSSFSYPIPRYTPVLIQFKDDRIVINGTDRISKGDYELCMKKSGISSGNNPIVDVSKC